MAEHLNRMPLKKRPKNERIRVVFCGGHHAGWAALSAFVEPWNWCYQNCEVVAVVPDRKDIPSAKGSLWDMDRSRWRIKMVPELAQANGLRVVRLNLYPGKDFNHEFARLLESVDADCFLSSTFRGIFRQEPLDLVKGTRGLLHRTGRKQQLPRAFNIHPTGIAVDRRGKPRIAWPQPLFEGKGAFHRMMQMSDSFQAGKSELDCPAMEWVIHRILPPPGIDRGEFVGANEFPIPLPHPEQRERGRRKQFNHLQGHCAAALPALLHQWGPHLFAGELPPWEDDPRSNT